MAEVGREPIPSCCGTEIVLLRHGRRANFAIWIWRCRICESFDSTNCRYDGETFWVGAMGTALQAELTELIADAYGSARPGAGDVGKG